MVNTTGTLQFLVVNLYNHMLGTVYMFRDPGLERCSLRVVLTVNSFHSRPATE